MAKTDISFKLPLEIACEGRIIDLPRMIINLIFLYLERGIDFIISFSFVFECGGCYFGRDASIVSIAHTWFFHHIQLVILTGQAADFLSFQIEFLPCVVIELLQPVQTYNADPSFWPRVEDIA